MNDSVSENIFVDPPEGFVDFDYPDHVCKPAKGFYGLNKTPRQWFAKFNAKHCELGFQSCTYGLFLYVKRTRTLVMMIKLYMDDLPMDGSDITEVTLRKNALAVKFEMEDCGKQIIV